MENTKIINIFFLSETILTKRIYRRKQGLMSSKNQSVQVAGCASCSANDSVFRPTEIYINTPLLLLKSFKDASNLHLKQ